MGKLGYLIHIIQNIERQQLPQGTVNADQFQGLLHGKFSPIGEVVGIRSEARASLINLVKELFEETKEYQRGANFSNLLQTTMNIIFDDYVDRAANTLNKEDIKIIQEKILVWFKEKSNPHTIYIPCIITTYPAISFSIGPIQFDYISQFITGVGSNHIAFQDMPNRMLAAGAHWVATVEVFNCIETRALEFGDLAVDLALAGLQLVFPINYCERIARMYAKNIPNLKSTFFRVKGNLSGGHHNQHPTLGLGLGWIETIVRDGATVLSSVGNRINGYLKERKNLPSLEQAWCDGAYWFHEGLAEPLETIAVTKLETAIDVLFHSSSTSKAKERLFQAIKLIYKLEPDQFINSQQTTTVKALVEGLIRDRSRILHGTWSTLMTNMQESRPNLIFLVRDFLKMYTLSLDRYLMDQAARDDIESFLDWIEANTPMP